MTGYFVTDFTLQDLKGLTAVQPFAFRTSEYNKGASIASISEIFAFAKKSWKSGGTAGLYMELKHPKYHSDLVSAPHMFQKNFHLNGIQVQQPTLQVDSSRTVFCTMLQS